VNVVRSAAGGHCPRLDPFIQKLLQIVHQSLDILRVLPCLLVILRFLLIAIANDVLLVLARFFLAVLLASIRVRRAIASLASETVASPGLQKRQRIRRQARLSRHEGSVMRMGSRRDDVIPSDEVPSRGGRNGCRRGGRGAVGRGEAGGGAGRGGFDAA